jgi:hypothetical protein
MAGRYTNPKKVALMFSNFCIQLCLCALLVQSWATACYIYNKQGSEAKALISIDREIGISEDRAISALMLTYGGIINLVVTVLLTIIIGLYFV